MPDPIEQAESKTENGIDKPVQSSIETAAAAGSPADLLKQAVSAARAKTIQTASSLSASKPQAGLRYAAIAACAMILGTAFGMIAAPKPSSDVHGPMQAALDAGRTEIGRLSAEVERLAQALTGLRENGEAVRAEVIGLDKSVADRLGIMEQSFVKKLAGLSDSVERTEREQTVQLTAQIEKRAVVAAAPAPSATIPAAPSPAKIEPAVTGALADAKPKTETLTGWALREVYAGVAILEDRKRRLIEVARGDLVPGIGRVEAVERRGRLWVVVTKQGIITPQTW